MAQRQSINLLFPLGGVVRRHAHQSEPPYTCYEALNVVPDDPFRERERGGSRPGTETVLGNPGSGNVDWIGSVGFVDEDGVVQRRVLTVSGGALYAEDGDGGLSEVGSGLATDGIITGVELNGKAYIAGGADEDRSVKVYDPKAGTFEDLTASAGEVPKGCRLIARYRGRLILARNIDTPNNIYMSRIGDATDWDYGANGGGSAVNLSTSEAGVVGEPVTCLVEHTDSCLLVGCLSSVWIIRGDPGFGGVVEQLATDVGILTHQSFCYSPDGTFWCMTQEGLYMMQGSCGGPFMSVSREKLPQELRGIDTENFRICMCYDQGLRGLLVFVTKYSFNDEEEFQDIDFGPETPLGGSPPQGSRLPTSHFFVDIRNTMGGDSTHRASASFWPLTFSIGQEPTAAANLRGGTGEFGQGIMGTRGGALRRFNTTLEDDEGEQFTSYVLYGPIQLGDTFNEGAIAEITATMAINSEEVEWELLVADNPELALHLKNPSYTGVWKSGASRTFYPRKRGRAVYIVVRGKNARWAIEGITLVREVLGRRRLRPQPTRPIGGDDDTDFPSL